ERSADGVLTYVYHLFPNVMIATFPTNVTMVVLEPVATDRTRLVTYVLTHPRTEDADGQLALQSAGQFVQAGAAEDRDVACSAQRGRASGATPFLESGRSGGPIALFHQELAAAPAATAS